MNRLLFWKVSAVASTAALATVLACGGGSAVVNHAGAAAQPNMEAARTKLAEARGLLERAEHNKGGHRVKAIELVDLAMAQIDQGMAAAD